MAKKILIVEDEEDILYFAKIRLKDADYEVMTANSAECAAELIVKHKPDLILLDLLLPGARGEEFCRKLKADEKFKNIPVILFTATAHRVADKIKETGAEDGIMKPFDPNVLLKKIKRFL
jgi:DNA-binding response OmpR family regulator